ACAAAGPRRPHLAARARLEAWTRLDQPRGGSPRQRSRRPIIRSASGQGDDWRELLNFLTKRGGQRGKRGRAAGAQRSRPPLALLVAPRRNQLFQLVHELAHVAKRAIHRSKSHVSRPAEPPQPRHDALPDERSRHLLLARFLQLALDLGRNALDGVDRNRPFLTGFLQPCDQLAPIEGLAPTILFDHERHHFFYPLASGEAPPAAEAPAPPPDDP